jgi:hypothetical protein
MKVATGPSNVGEVVKSSGRNQSFCVHTSNLKTLAVTRVVILNVIRIPFQFGVKEDTKLGPMGVGVDVTNPPESKYHDLARLDLFHLVCG